LTRWAALTAELAKITQPALVASGHRDIMAPAINSCILAQHIPDAQLITYPDSGTASCSGTPACSWPTSPASPDTAAAFTSTCRPQAKPHRPAAAAAGRKGAEHE
jgi:hypothetical protein